MVCVGARSNGHSAARRTAAIAACGRARDATGGSAPCTAQHGSTSGRRCSRGAAHGTASSERSARSASPCITRSGGFGCVPTATGDAKRARKTSHRFAQGHLTAYASSPRDGRSADDNRAGLVAKATSAEGSVCRASPCRRTHSAS